MKNTFPKIVSFLILSCSLTSFYAQNITTDSSAKTITIVKTIRIDSSSLKPGKGNVSAAMNITGLIKDLRVEPLKEDVYEHILLKYYLKDNSALRFGLGINSVNNKLTKLDSLNGILIQQDSSFKKTSLYITLGYEYHFKDTKRLDPYIGGIMTLGSLGKQKLNYSLSQKDTIGQATLSNIQEIPGGGMFRIGALTGFNFFIAKNISIGVEYSLGYTFSTTGGDYSLVTINNPLNGAEKVTRITGTNYTTSSQINWQQRGNIIFTYSFGNKK